MAECKNCLHEKVCKFADEKVSIATTVKETIHDCKDFQNKADFVEVVRCGKCKHKGWIQEPCHGRSVPYCRIHDMCVDNNAFCSYGKRSDT